MKKTLWGLLDDRAGSVGQAKGIFVALQDRMEIVEKQIVYNKYASLPNFIRGRTLIGVDTQKSSPLTAETYPDIVLSISRRTLPIARYIRKMSGYKTKIIQLMYSGLCGLGDIELMILSEHDRRKHSPAKFFYITGCPHRITEKSMAEAKEKWMPVFDSLPKPLTSVIVGGKMQGRDFTIENAVDMAKEIRKFKEKIGGSILITTSRRTGQEQQDAIMKELADLPAYTFLWGEKKDNPYMGFLACAESHIVTGDSVSMCSEACGTGAPVLIFSGKDWLTPKHERFVRSMVAGGYAVDLDAEDATAFRPRQKLDNSDQVATRILEIR